MVQKKGLGRGLNILIPDMPNSLDREEETVPQCYINVSEIERNREQPRKSFDEAELEELSNSIKKFGILQPLLVRKQEEYYEIIAGERRFRAAKLAGLKKVPVIIKDFTQKEMVEVALIENIQRKDLNPIEEALAFQKLIQEFDMTHEEIAEKISKSRVSVTNSLRLLKLDTRVQQFLIEEKLSSGHARVILSISSLDSQYEIAKRVVEESLSVRETESLIKKIQQEEKVETKEKKIQTQAIFLHTIEEAMKEIIGTKVIIKSKKDSTGKIEIQYYSKEELERLLELFQRIKEN